MSRSFPKFISMAIVLSMLSGCIFKKEDPENTDNNTPNMADMADMDMGDEADAAGDMNEPPSDDCTVDDDCVGDFEGFYCIADKCTECDSGDLDCVCRANGTCKEDLVCGEDGLCEPCTLGDENCGCDAGACTSTDELTLECVDDVCVENTCVDGDTTCLCDDGACTDANDYCSEMNTCQECSSDVPGCACDSDGTCLGDNYCDDDTTCQVCPEIDKPDGCVCDSNSDCETGLACDEDDRICRPKLECDVLCVPFQECDESGAGDPICIPDTCQMGYTWDNGACVQDMGTTCVGRNGTTDLSATCAMNSKTCVEDATGSAVCVDTCDTLQADCEAQLRDCEPAVNITDDAICGACKPGYADDGAGTCVVDTSQNCSTFGDPDSIADECAARNQECEEIMGGGAQCGACLSGYEFNTATNSCFEALLCGGVVCGEDEYCSYPQSGAPPSCEPAACAAGQAYDETAASCVTCNLSCDEEGVYPVTIDGACACASDVFCRYQTDGASNRCFVNTCADGEAADPQGTCNSCAITCGDTAGERARLWPETTIDGTCFCEVQEGYSIPFGGSGAPQECDEDGDGWINSTANATFNTATASSDEAVLANFRCDRREIDRVILQNEWGQQRAISMCGDDLIDYNPDNIPTCTDIDGLKSLVLFEADALDDDDAIALNTTQFPASGNRQFAAAELNSLTKACVDLNGDFNSNMVEDIEEEHAIEKTRLSGVTFSGDAASEQFLFHSVSYFVELHRGYYQANINASAPGSYVIAERSRCDADFAVGHASSGEYVSQCTRLRRADFQYGQSQTGHDFGHWSCTDTADGSCGMFDPPFDASKDDQDGDNIPDHGLCDRSDPMPNEPWRGMTHHSQFQCVVLKNTVTSGNNHELAVNQVYNSGEATPAPYEFNSCVAEDCSSGIAGCITTTDQGVYQPDSPAITCTQYERDDNEVAQDVVGWVAVRYVPEGVSSSLARPYIRGCIDESYGLDGTDGWVNLCPGYDNNPDAVLAAGNPGDSGKLICSCSRFFGGENCEVSCVERHYANAANADAINTSFVHVGDIDRGYNVEQIAEYACSADDGYCSLHPPVPADGFGGGRRGYWLCGTTTLTDTRDANGENVPYLEGSGTVDGVTSSYQIEGTIKLAPVQRVLVEQENCTTGCYSAF